jgi:hypothetical protein
MTLFLAALSLAVALHIHLHLGRGRKCGQVRLGVDGMMRRKAPSPKKLFND